MLIDEHNTNFVSFLSQDYSLPDTNGLFAPQLASTQIDSPLSAILEAISNLSKRLQQVEEKVDDVGKGVWNQAANCSQISKTLASMSGRMGSVEKMVLASNIQISDYFPINSRDRLDEMRERTAKEPEFKIALVS